MKWKEKTRSLVESQKGNLDKFVQINVKTKFENSIGCSLNEQVNDIGVSENENREVGMVSEQDNNIDTNESENRDLILFQMLYCL